MPVENFYFINFFIFGITFLFAENLLPSVFMAEMSDFTSAVIML